MMLRSIIRPGPSSLVGVSCYDLVAGDNTCTFELIVHIVNEARITKNTIFGFSLEDDRLKIQWPQKRWGDL